MESGANIQKVQELLRTAVETYSNCNATILLDALKQSYSLVSSGNGTFAVANILKSAMSSFIGVAPQTEVKSFGARPEVKEIKVYDLESKLTSDKAVIRLLR